MRIHKQILTSFLVLMILSSGLPVFSPEDANRDSRVNLKDAILNIRDFARTADDLEAFSSELGKAITTLKEVAGLKTSYKPAKDSNTSNTQTNLNTPYLIPTYHLPAKLNICFKIPDESFCYKSIVLSPIPHPPQDISIG